MKKVHTHTHVAGVAVQSVFKACTVRGHEGQATGGGEVLRAGAVRRGGHCAAVERPVWTLQGAAERRRVHERAVRAVFKVL